MDDAILPSITTAFTGLRPVEARKTENPPAATPVQRFVSRLWIRDSHVSANLTCKEAVDFSMPRYRGGLIVGRIEVDSVLCTLAEQATAERFNVADQVLTLHVIVRSKGSRDTV